MHSIRRRVTTPLATVAMVTFNSGEFVREAIESVLAQDFGDFELLICDDCSVDDTWEIATSFRDPRIRTVRGVSNIGEYRNRNKALRLARGKYLMYLDGDDILYPHGLHVMVRNMERFPDAAFASALPPCEKFIYPVELTPRQYCSCVYFGPNILANDFTQLFFSTRPLREAGGFDLRYRCGDLRIQYALGMRCNVLLVGSGLAWWRKRPGQASEPLRDSGRAITEIWRCTRELLDDPACPLTAAERAMARENMSRLVLRQSVRLLLRGQVRDAKRLAFETGVPAREIRCLFGPYEKPYLRTVTGAHPIRLGIGRSAPAPRLMTPPGARRARLAPLQHEGIDLFGVLRMGPPPLDARAAQEPQVALDVFSGKERAEAGVVAAADPIEHAVT